jgi:hypothetical protein
MKVDTMKPDQVCGWIQRKIREIYGDRVENKSVVFASHGFYYIQIYQGKHRGWIRLAEYTLRRKNLPALFKKLASEK